MVNINQLFNTKITLAKGILLFYLAVGNNFLKNLYPGQLTDVIDKSRLAQHVIGFITMFVLIDLASDTSKLDSTLIYSTIAYLLFVLTTKLDLHWNLAIVILLIAGYLYERRLETKEVNSEKDPSLNKGDIMKIHNKNNKIKTTILITLIIITGIGTYFYHKKKITQYGGNYDNIKFLFGGRNILSK